MDGLLNFKTVSIGNLKNILKKLIIRAELLFKIDEVYNNE
jgi:hypothetical protein